MRALAPAVDALQPDARHQQLGRCEVLSPLSASLDDEAGSNRRVACSSSRDKHHLSQDPAAEEDKRDGPCASAAWSVVQLPDQYDALEEKKREALGGFVRKTNTGRGRNQQKEKEK